MNSFTSRTGVKFLKSARLNFSLRRSIGVQSFTALNQSPFTYRIPHRHFGLHFPDSDVELRQIISDSKDKLIVVDWTATWCQPCRRMSPHFNKFADSKEYENVTFIKVDVDELPEVSQLAGIKSVPTFQFLKNGKMLHQFSGADIQQLEETITKFK